MSNYYVCLRLWLTSHIHYNLLILWPTAGTHLSCPSLISFGSIGRHLTTTFTLSAPLTFFDWKINRKHHTPWSTTTSLATENWSDPCINNILHDLPLPALPLRTDQIHAETPYSMIYHYQPCHWELIRSMHKHTACFTTTSLATENWSDPCINIILHDLPLPALPLALRTDQIHA